MSQAVMGGHELLADRQVLGGRASQSLFGVIAIILGIVGLAIATTHPGVPIYLDAIAAIALGVNLIVIGIYLAASYGRLLARLEPTAYGGDQMVGTTADMFLGGAVVILGILALLRIAAPVLVPVEVILIGVGLLLNSAAVVRLYGLQREATAGNATVRRVGEEFAMATASVRAIAAIAVIILGIVSVVGTEPLILSLAAMIVAGTALLVSSTSLSGKMLGTLMPRA